MLNLSQLLPVPPIVVGALCAIYKLLKLSLPMAARPGIRARTRVEIFLTTAAYVGLLLIAVVVVLAIGALTVP